MGRSSSFPKLRKSEREMVLTKCGIPDRSPVLLNIFLQIHSGLEEENS